MKQRLITVAGFAHRDVALAALTQGQMGAEIRHSSVYELGETVVNEGLDYSRALERVVGSPLDDGRANVCVGWSMGGIVALELAARKVDLFSKLVLISSTASFCSREGYAYGSSTEELGVFGAKLESDRRGLLESFFSRVYGLEAQPELVAERVETALLMESDILEDNLRYLENTDLRDVLKDVKAQCLVLHGTDDPVITVDHAEFLVAQLPNAELQVIEDGSHAFCVNQSRECAARISEFLGR